MHALLNRRASPARCVGDTLADFRRDSLVNQDMCSMPTAHYERHAPTRHSLPAETAQQITPKALIPPKFYGLSFHDPFHAVNEGRPTEALRLGRLSLQAPSVQSPPRCHSRSRALAESGTAATGGGRAAPGLLRRVASQHPGLRAFAGRA
jgi:hypothetical protein